MNTSAIPDHASLRPIQEMPVPVKVRLAVSPVSVESCALPPLCTALVLANHTPVQLTRGSVSSILTTAVVGDGLGDVVGEGEGVAVAVGRGVAVTVMVAVAVNVMVAVAVVVGRGV